ncbi:hypothetical protein [Flavobacterium sangjuense]|uniref:Uncharacterized protein n=1 Tax=Flavobacterium sangjuense TaxID=2518177 RepID=A0A4P7PU78_9FLAO|nr:hypothetical protein [Flavobacterium sangjuense]QBZ98521.1 hypothetical protein GS03_02029 [Flavobacterium sangjuense]
MKTPEEKDFLMERIIALEIKQKVELELLKLQFHSTVEQLNPLYFIKNSFKQLTAAPEIKSGLLDSAVNMTSQYLTRNPFLGRFQKPIKNILGNVLMTVLNKLSPKKEPQH